MDDLGKLINLDRLTEFYELLKNNDLKSAYSLSNDLYDVRLTSKWGLSNEVHIPIYYDTTANWNATPSLESQKGAIYIYSDYKKDANNKDVPGIKIGDGDAYVIDMPFIDAPLWEHINNSGIHVTPAEKEFWNNKVTAYLSGDNPKLLVFSKN